MIEIYATHDVKHARQSHNTVRNGRQTYGLEIRLEGPYTGRKTRALRRVP